MAAFRHMPPADQRLRPMSDLGPKKPGRPIGGLVRGGVDSERRVHPCGRRPRPTGRDIALDTAVFANRLLADLPRADFELLGPHLSIESLAQGKVLAEAGDEIEHACFPHSGMISLLTMLKDGKAIETATIGREGVFGAAAAFGLYRTKVRAIIQLPMTAAMLPSPVLRRAAEGSKAIQ